ncbi:hypothetical protein Lbru_1694 [Legionella brunensis]|uniref:Uncharacterized protein n=2 Tax=Legionella brunensis TaxID=29422 RepID=A0A0W0SKM2_9GAMM|nr:hypothetical protein Lbru_1694 [Legionella brunensis]
MQTNLILLPHEPSIVISDIVQRLHYIHLMQQLLERLLTALDSFENNHLSRFDAQVGETLCQIRAYKIYTLKSHPTSECLSHLKDLKRQCLNTKETLSAEEARYQYYITQNKTLRPQSIRDQITLSDFFKAMNCHFSITDDTLFLFLSHFLCEFHVVDEEQIPMAIDYPAIAQKLNLSRSYTKKLGHYYQKLLSEMSCKFMFQLVEDFPGNEELKHLLPWLHKQSDEGRMVLPCYTVTDIIVSHMIENQASMVLVIDIQNENKKERLTFSFEGSKDKANFDISNQVDTKNPCMVMYGGCHTTDNFFKKSFLSKLLTIGVKEVLLSNNAAHPQYSGATLKQFRDNPFQVLVNEYHHEFSSFETCLAQNLSNELIKKKALANALGCTAENQSFFLLKHIFCDTLDSYQIEEISNEGIPLKHPIPRDALKKLA